MVRQEKSKKAPRSKQNRPLRLSRRGSHAHLPSASRQNNGKNHLSSIASQQSILHRLQSDQQDTPLHTPLNTQLPLLPITLSEQTPFPVETPPSSSILIGQSNQNESVLAQASDAAVRWGSVDETFPLQWPLWGDESYHEESSDDIWRPREFMHLRRRHQDSPQPLRLQFTEKVPVETFEKAVGAFEVTVEGKEELVEESQMKGEEEGYVDDLEDYEEWMQAQTARLSSPE